MTEPIRITCELRDDLMAQIVECVGTEKRADHDVRRWETDNGLEIVDIHREIKPGHRDCEHYARPVR